MSAVVWQRMLRILGDINNIPDPSMYHLAFKTLLNVWRHLVEVRRRGGGGTKRGKGRREREVRGREGEVEWTSEEKREGGREGEEMGKGDRKMV